MANKLKGRKGQVEDARKQKEEERIEQEKLAEVQKEKEQERIKELTKKKEILLTHIKEGQKLIFKGYYSRPPYPFNRKAYEYNMKHEDFAWLDEGAKKDAQKKIISRLFEKVKELEDKVTDDVKTDYFTRQQHGGSDYDTMSNFDAVSAAGVSTNYGAGVGFARNSYVPKIKTGDASKILG